jgi:hypothetical protein
MTDGGQLPWQRRAQLVIAIVALAVGPGLLTSNPLAGLVPLLVLAYLYCLWRAPLRWATLGLFFIALTVESPQEKPAFGLWKTPLSEPGALLYENLNNLTGIKPLRFSALDLIVVLLVAAIVVRRYTDRPSGGPSGLSRSSLDAPFPTASGLNPILATVLLTLLALEALGLARGGDFKASLWQIRELLWLPVLVWIFQATLRGPRDLVSIGLIVIAACVLKTAEGLYFYQVICRPLNLRPPYVTTHSDSLLFVTVLVMGVVVWLLERSRRRWMMLPVVATAAVGLVINNRRLAIVGLIANLVLIYLVLPRSKMKRSITRYALLSLPIISIYVAAGWQSNAAIFGPVRMLTSVLSKDDRSSETRDIENFNLLQTLKVKPILGWGFGHEYLEFSKADDISKYFALYRYIGHNSVLWLWTVGGLLGFALFWSLIAFTIYLSARAFGWATGTVERAGALVALSVAVAFMVQAYGDMGLQSWTGVFLLAVALASVSQLAVAVGAWPPAPERVRLAPDFGWTVPRAEAEENA